MPVIVTISMIQTEISSVNRTAVLKVTALTQLTIRLNKKLMMFIQQITGGAYSKKIKLVQQRLDTGELTPGMKETSLFQV